MDRMGSRIILSIKLSVTIGTIIKFDGDRDDTCERAFCVDITVHNSKETGLKIQIVLVVKLIWNQMFAGFFLASV